MKNQSEIDVFQNDLKELGIILSERQMEQFFRYFEILTEWNKKINLTAITEYGDVLKKHFVDSLCLTKVYDLSRPATVIDVGTGAGFPGLALKIAFPGLKITLLDSLRKRIQFLDVVIEELGLSDVETMHGRAEDFARPEKLREHFDLCVSRAVANLSVLSEYCLPFVKTGGLFVSYKSEKADLELEEAKGAIKLLGGRPEGKEEFFLPGSDISRSLLLVRKTEKTLLKYPRKAGLPAREPLK